MSSSVIKSLKELQFDNRSLKCLPIDPVQDNYTRTVKNACFSMVKPTKLDNPRLVCHSSSALQLIDLDEQSIDDYFVDCFAGNDVIPGTETAAHCYCGHQFGSFAGQLGDGAVIYLGEVVNSKSERWELQLKGAGLTPFSRQADGRKVLRSSLREFLCSEAMHHLKIGTTRAATCIVSDTKVERDQFYDGHPKMENCAIISRLAPTFIRFGSFEISKKIDPSTGYFGPSVGNHEIIATMANFVIESYFPKIYNSDANMVDKYKLFYKDVVIKTAKLVAQWQAVGFVHGVLNTDNMSILGLTLDYGPFGFLDRFDPDHIPNTSDHNGRYRFKKQPEVCFWNLWKFAEALESLVPIEELKIILKDSYYATYKEEYLDLMLRKLGLLKKVPEKIDDIISDEDLIDNLLATLDEVGGDYTNCFRKLNLLTIPGLSNFDESLDTLKKEFIQQSSTFEEMMLFYENFINTPMVYMRMVLLQNFKEKLDDDQDTLLMLKRIYRYQHLKEINSEQFQKELQDSWNSWLDLYIKRIKFETKDMDPVELMKYDTERKKMMNSINPRYVLRNHLAQNAIENAEQMDFSEAKRLLKALENPFDEDSQFDDYTKRPIRTSCSIRVSCSS